MSKTVSNGSSTLIVSFAGHGKGMGTIPQFEFVNFLNKHFKHVDQRFYLDTTNKWYSLGIDGVSTSIEDTVAHLTSVIAPYTKTVFIGSSAGGYAAILFGSLVSADVVIGFKPQTILPIKQYAGYDDLRPFINSTTRYEIVGDATTTDAYHDIKHCENIDVGPNVHVHRLPSVDMKQMRDSGELLKLFVGVLTNL